MSDTCDLRRLSPNTVNNLCKLAIASFEKALHALKERRGEDYTAMDLLKEWGKHTPYMVELLLDTEWRKHDNFYSRKSAYMAILYQTFLDFCEENHMGVTADEIDKSTFKGKVNCYFSEYRNNIPEEEERDQVMQKAMMVDLPRFIHNTQAYKNKDVDYSSLRSIVTEWIKSLGDSAYQIISWRKHNPLSFEDLVKDDFDWVVDRMFIGNHVEVNYFISGEDVCYCNGRHRIQYDCAFDVVERELKGKRWEDDLERADVKKALIHMIYWAGVNYGIRDDDRY